MGVRRADDMSVQRPDRNRKIVGIAAAARQQCGVLLAEDGFAELSGHIPASFSLAFLSTSVSRYCQHARWRDICGNGKERRWIKPQLGPGSASRYAAARICGWCAAPAATPPTKIYQA